MKHIKLFETFTFINESNVIQDLRKNGDLFSALLFKNELILVDNSSKIDHDNAIYRNLNDLDKSVYDADVHLIINIKKKTISFPNEQRSDYFNKQDAYRTFDGRYKTQISKSQDPDKVNKLIKDLKSRNIITDKFKLIDFNSEDLTTVNDKNIYLYHGTTKTAAEQIKKKGLRPMDTELLLKKSMFRGNSSTIKGYTDKNVYLTPSLDIAKSYAWRQSNHNNNDIPVVLKIQIPDPHKLYIDDDKILLELLNCIIKDRNLLTTTLEKDSADYPSVLKFAEDTENPIIKKLFSKFNLENYPTIFIKTPWSNNYLYSLGDYEKGLIQANLFSIINGGGIKEKTVRLSYNDSDEMAEYFQDQAPGYFEWLENKILQYYPQILQMQWQKSAYGNEQAAAYNGVILPKFIEEIPIQYKLKKY
jgi:hypothetical protein